MPKRKSTSVATQGPAVTTVPIPPPSREVKDSAPSPPKRRASGRRKSQPAPDTGSTNPDKNANVLDAPEALRASPDADEKDERMNLEEAGMDVEKQIKEDDESVLSELADVESPVKPKKNSAIGKSNKTKETKARLEAKKVPAPATKSKKEAINVKEPQFLDPEAEGDEEADEEELKAALSRPPPVNSDYLPLPWKGRLGYACLCTYLRFSNPPVFSSRTCRIASILENRHPLKDPNEPPHATKNRPDREQPADVARGQAFVESLGKANAKDVVKMLRWNDRYGIKFLRLSSEMFPFASHLEYGYKLAPFVSEEMAEAGRVAAELGHRLTTHPGQFTQLGSPRKQVIDASFRDLDYHAELLSLLKLPPQQDRDAVMILHLGGVFGDKQATLDRFRTNYSALPQNVKDRLVLENDDVSWSVRDLLPLCEELNIPMVLDFHHNNIIFSDEIREGTRDIIDLFPRILATWRRKNITPKMHYSEPTPSAITGRQRRKHNPRVATLPPCPPDMDLMIEAKDKEQAVFELMRTFKLPGFDTFNDILPHVRKDDNKPIPKKKSTPKKKSKAVKNEDDDEEALVDAVEEQAVVPEEEIGMGGSEGRVYWPPGMEHWLRPVKKVIKPKEPKNEGNGEMKMTPAKKKAAAAAAKLDAARVEEEAHVDGKGETAPAKKKTLTVEQIGLQNLGTKISLQGEDMTKMSPASKKKAAEEATQEAIKIGMERGFASQAAEAADRMARGKPPIKAKPKRNGVKKAASKKKGKTAKAAAAPSDDEDEDEEMEELDDGGDDEEEEPAPKKVKTNGAGKAVGKRTSARAKRVSYAEEGDEV